jgi:hypothetical protein
MKINRMQVSIQPKNSNSLPCKYFIAILLFFSLFTGISSITWAQTPLKATGSQYAFESSPLYLAVDTADGSRIVSLKWNDTEILYLQSSIDMNGSTFWPAPQSLWGWPPLAAIDNKPYKVTLSGNKLILSSATEKTLGIRVYKAFSMDKRDSSILIKYYIKNEGSKSLSLAPWEITRVPLNGPIIFSKEDGDVWGTLASDAVEMNGCFWYDQQNSHASNNANKFFVNGKGWLAYVNAKDRLVFIKKFDDISSAQFAPGEAEIEVYTTPDKVYTEIENQGKYVNISSKDSIEYSVRWIVRDIPENIECNVGDSLLVKYVKYLIGLPQLPDTSGVPNAVRHRYTNKTTNDNEFYVSNSIAYLGGISSDEFPILINVYNLLGNQVVTKRLYSSVSSMEINGLPPGMYVIAIKGTKKLSLCQKFIVK